jgi:hypothetical protein
MRVSSLASIRGLAGMSDQDGAGDGQQPWAVAGQGGGARRTCAPGPFRSRTGCDAGAGRR